MQEFLICSCITKKEPATLHIPPQFCLITGSRLMHSTITSLVRMTLCFCVCPTGSLLCTRCWGRMNSPLWRTQTVRMEKTRPQQPDMLWCRSTIAGCSTLGVTSSMRTAHACRPYQGDTQHHTCHVISQDKQHSMLCMKTDKGSSGSLPPSQHAPLCLQTVCTGFF